MPKKAKASADAAAAAAEPLEEKDTLATKQRVKPSSDDNVAIYKHCPSFVFATFER
jgi:hypothetical protein